MMFWHGKNQVSENFSENSGQVVGLMSEVGKTSCMSQVIITRCPSTPMRLAPTSGRSSQEPSGVVCWRALMFL